ncbi:hypothetical protein FGO68_gene10544 [Halteria grandinella]|uniref:Uncharacterized protein n=1 Tax=Halteria grandinella TaxID=5974 RepID=A0A8J8NLK4_HALGN|nr:hypothetical protein FGO68_gene10544 [Halteria grandinella]
MLKIREKTEKRYSINGALLTILQNRLATSDIESNVLLFGSESEQTTLKADDKQESFKFISNIINMSEAVIMDRDRVFTEIDSHLTQHIQASDNSIEALIGSFSQQKFLGYCCLQQNRASLELDQKEKDRCAFLMEALGLSRIFFGIFTLTYLDQHNARPEPGQNYDTNHIVKFHFKMFEIERGPKNLSLFPIRLEILNLVSTQALSNHVPMSQYAFVNDGIVQQMDEIGNQIKQEINAIIAKRETFFQELRQNEKKREAMMRENAQIREQIQQVMREMMQVQHGAVGQ